MDCKQTQIDLFNTKCCVASMYCKFISAESKGNDKLAEMIMDKINRINFIVSCVDDYVKSIIGFKLYKKNVSLQTEVIETSKTCMPSEQVICDMIKEMKSLCC